MGGQRGKNCVSLDQFLFPGLAPIPENSQEHKTSGEIVRRPVSFYPVVSAAERRFYLLSRPAYSMTGEEVESINTAKLGFYISSNDKKLLPESIEIMRISLIDGFSLRKRLTYEEQRRTAPPKMYGDIEGFSHGGDFQNVWDFIESSGVMQVVETETELPLSILAQISLSPDMLEKLRDKSNDGTYVEFLQAGSTHLIGHNTFVRRRMFLEDMFE